MSGFLLDTHVWLWYASGIELTKSIQKTITDALQNRNAYLAAISLWEVCMLDKKQRITLDMPVLEWINKFIDVSFIQIIPLTSAIARESCFLPGEFHEDPADRMIVATARIEQLTLITRDARILTYNKHHLVSTLSA